MCTGRVDLAFVLRAFAKGADGVLIGGCWPGECHYVTEGNYDALANTHLCRKLLGHIGVSPERLRLEWISAAQGSRFAEVTSELAQALQALGPLGSGVGSDGKRLARRLEALGRLVPYLKLVARARLRPPVRSEQAYNAFFGGAQFGRVFDELIADRVAASQIVVLLAQGRRTSAEIAADLGLSASEVARHMNGLSRAGVVAYEAARRCYALRAHEAESSGL